MGFPGPPLFLGKLVQRLEEEDETGRPCKHPEDQLPPVHPGIVTLNITEPQITSILAFRLQSDPNMQTDKKPFITDPQVYLRDGR